MEATFESPLEQSLSAEVARFHKEQQGHSPTCQCRLVENLAIVHTMGIFTSTEVSLSTDTEGRKLIQSARREQRALTRRDIEARVEKILGRPVVRSFYDLDVRSGEQMEVYLLA